MSKRILLPILWIPFVLQCLCIFYLLYDFYLFIYLPCAKLYELVSLSAAPLTKRPQTLLPSHHQLTEYAKLSPSGCTVVEHLAGWCPVFCFVSFCFIFCSEVAKLENKQGFKKNEKMAIITWPLEQKKKTADNANVTPRLLHQHVSTSSQFGGEQLCVSLN